MSANVNKPQDLTYIADHPEYAAMIQQALAQTTAAFANTPSRQQTALLKKIIEDSDVCIGVFDDPASPQGSGHLIIKGAQVLMGIAGNGRGATLNLAVIPCREPAEAHAMKQVFGKKR
jgi:hypothetical protein